MRSRFRVIVIRFRLQGAHKLYTGSDWEFGPLTLNQVVRVLCEFPFGLLPLIHVSLGLSLGPCDN